MPDDPTMAQVLEDVIDAKLAETNTILPGEVVAWDSSNETVDVRPLVSRPSGDEYPIIRGAKAVFPVAYFDLAKGDTGLILCGQWDFARWWRTGTVGTPEHLGQHSMASACFLPGIRRKATSRSVPSGATVLTGDDVRLGVDSAAEAVIRGDAYTGHEDTFLAALSTWVGQVGGALSSLGYAAGPAEAAVLTTAIGVFRGQLSGDLSAKVSVD